LIGVRINTKLLSTGAIDKAIFSGCTTAIALGKTSQNTIITIDIRKDAKAVPCSPYKSINKVVTRLVERILTRVLATSKLLISFPLFFNNLTTSAALLLPSDLSLCILPGEEPVTAVSEAEHIADTASKIITEIENSIILRRSY
jgi:hypothetical protein